MSRVRYEKKDHVAFVTLDRPEVLNAMDLRTHEELAGIWDDVEADDDVRVAVLTGAGDRAFSVGQDLKERAALDRDGARPTTFGSRAQPGWPRLTERFTLSKPVVARVRGYAPGGGFELALACDLIVASDDAVFALPEATLGLVPGAGGAFRLARQLPLKVAMAHLLTGRRMSAAEALGFGLVNACVQAALTQADRDVANCGEKSGAIEARTGRRLGRLLPRGGDESSAGSRHAHGRPDHHVGGACRRPPPRRGRRGWPG